jgi:hypothetical protein
MSEFDRIRFEADAEKSAKRLHQRIASGEAEPISDREREQLKEIRAIYKARFGDDYDSQSFIAVKATIGLP